MFAVRADRSKLRPSSRKFSTAAPTHGLSPDDPRTRSPGVACRPVGCTAFAAANVDPYEFDVRSTSTSIAARSPPRPFPPTARRPRDAVRLRAAVAGGCCSTGSSRSSTATARLLPPARIMLGTLEMNLPFAGLRSRERDRVSRPNSSPPRRYRFPGGDYGAPWRTDLTECTGRVRCRGPGHPVSCSTFHLGAARRRRDVRSRRGMHGRRVCCSLHWE